MINMKNEEAAVIVAYSKAHMSRSMLVYCLVQDDIHEWIKPAQDAANLTVSIKLK